MRLKSANFRIASAWIGSILLVVATLAAVGGLGFYKYRQLEAAKRTPPPPEMPISVVVRAATQVNYRPNTTMIGTVLAERSIMLSNELPGTVSHVGFVSGQIVEAGQALIELDTSVEQAQLDASKARRRIAESTYQRILDAASPTAFTPSERDEAEAMLAQATAEVSELEAIIGRKKLRAPFRAKIGLSNTHVGQFLPSGSEIASLQSLDDFVYVDFMVPQVAADSVQIGQTVQLFVDRQQLTAEIFALDAQADRQSRNLLARARLASRPNILVPGDSVKVQLDYGQEIVTAAVPLEALRRAPMNSFVFVVRGDDQGKSRAFERSVEAGPTVDRQLSILAGIEPGERVVADGSFKLRDGALIVPSPSSGFDGE